MSQTVVNLTTTIVRDEKGGVYAKSLVLGSFDVNQAETKIAIKLSWELLNRAGHLGATRTTDGALYFPPDRVKEIERGE